MNVYIYIHSCDNPDDPTQAMKQDQHYLKHERTRLKEESTQETEKLLQLVSTIENGKIVSQKSFERQAKALGRITLTTLITLINKSRRCFYETLMALIALIMALIHSYDNPDEPYISHEYIYSFL